MSFIDRFRPSQSTITPEQESAIVSGDTPTISTCVRVYGEGTVNTVIILHLQQLNNYCGTQNKLDASQMEQFCTVVRSRFGYLKPEELVVFFTRFMAGEYGRFYGSMDPLFLAEALGRFDEWRKELRGKSLRERERREKAEREQVVSKASQKYINYLRKKHGLGK
jgi:hypothetical protein